MVRIYKKNFFNILKIVSLLKKGKVGVIPTDTVYGISGKVPDTEKLIFKIKGRIPEKAFIQLIAKKKDISNYTDTIIPNSILKHWPGPLTIIVKLKSSEKSVAFRCPADRWLRILLNFCKFPLYSTSVNRTGSELKTNIKDIVSEFSNELDFIVDSGELNNLPSTIVDLTGKEPKVLRQGIIKID
ncbi:MAG: L-threonylcarbamoyladenylate synthase [Treponema sp.]|nr:L-threonylcarbamoyladenylate synthase [Treponema sp.]